MPHRGHNEAVLYECDERGSSADIALIQQIAGVDQSTPTGKLPQARRYQEG